MVAVMPRTLLALLIIASLPVLATEQPPEPTSGSLANDAGGHLDRGASLLYQGLYDEAIVEFERALELDPGYAKARLNLATAYFYKKDYPKAEREYLRCLKAEPGYVNARFNLAIVYQAQDKLDEALATYRVVLDADPRRAQAWKNIGRIHQQRGELEKAAAAYERSLAIDPTQKAAADLRRHADDLRVRATAESMVTTAEPPAEPPAEPAAEPTAPRPESATAELEQPKPAPTPAAATDEPPKMAQAPEATQPAGASPAPPSPEPAPEAAPPIDQLPAEPAVLARRLAALVTTQGEGTTLLCSAPLGAKVFLRREALAAKDPFNEYGSFGANKKSRAFREMARDIVADKFYRGRTPLALDLEPGHYQIAFQLDGRQEMWLVDGDVHVQTSTIALVQEKLPTDIKLYELTIHEHDVPRYLVSLFVAGDGDGGAGSTCDEPPFPVDDGAIRSALAPFHVPDDAIDRAIRAVGCTGKALLIDDRGPLVIALRGGGRFTVERQR